MPDTRSALRATNMPARIDLLTDAPPSKSGRNDLDSNRDVEPVAPIQLMARSLLPLHDQPTS